MASIFDRIRQKAQAAITGVGNFLDQDKSMQGIQAVQGGLGNRVQKFFAPTPEVRPRDIVRELPGATAQVARDSFVRPIFRGIQSLTSTAQQGLGLGDGITTPEQIQQAMPNDTARNIMYGDEPILSLQRQTEKYSPQLSEILQRGGVAPDTAGKIAPPLTFLGAGALTAMDAVPGDPTDLIRGGGRAVANEGGQLLLENILKQEAKNAVMDSADEVAPVAVRSLEEILQPKVVENYLKPAGGANPIDFIANEAGEVSKVKKMTRKATDDLFSTMKPETERVGEGATKLLSAPAEALPLPQPQSSVTIAQLRKLAGQGDNLDGVTVLAKDADEMREASRLGVPKERIQLPEQVTKTSSKVLNFPQEEDAIYSPVKDALAGVQKSKLQRAWDAVVPSSRGVIEKSAPSGKRITALMDQADLEGSLASGAQSDVMQTVLKGLSKQEKATLSDVIEGKIRPMSEAQAQASETWKTIAAEIHKQGKAVGLELGEIENYFPHHTIQEGGNKSVKGMLGRTAERRYGNLEMARQNDLPYDKDPSVLMDYIAKANRRIADAKNFGADDRILYNLTNQVAKEGGDANQVRIYLDQILGKNQSQGMEDVSRTVRNVETISKLSPTSTLTNLTQNLSTMMRTDPKSMAGAISKIISNPQEAFSNALKSGEIDADLARTLAENTGSGNLASKWLKLIGFGGAEKMNRVVAVNAGIEYSNKLIKQAKNGSQAAVRELGRLGFDTADLDKIEPLLGGRAVSQATQFSTKPGELPYGWQTPIGRILTQFKSFAYKQTGFAKDEAVRVVSEGRKGNLKPFANFLTTYGIAAPIVGEVILDAKSLITNKTREDEGFERYVNNIIGATSLGLLDSIPGLTGKYGGTGVVGTVAGPAAGDIAKGGETVANLTSGDETKVNTGVRNIVKQVPGVGNTLANTFVPNSYVDNQNIPGTDINLGVNEGLGKEDSQTYKNIQKINSSKAELFKESAQTKRDQKNSEDGLLSKIFGGKKEVSVPAGTATAEDKKAYRKQVQDVLDQGVTPSNDVLKDFVFKGKSATSKSVEERGTVYKALESALSNENYTEEQKTAILKASGAKKEDAEYFTLAAKDPDARLQELLPKFDNMDTKTLTLELMKGRRALGGKQLITNAMVDYLYEKDYIGENEKEAIKAVKWDEITDTPYISKSFAKQGAGKKLSYSQAKALFKIDFPKFSTLKGISALLRDNPPTSQRGGGDDRLIENILNTRTGNRQKDNRLWF